MNRLSRTVALVALLAGCGDKGKARSLLPLDITVAPEVGTPAEVEVFITQGADSLGSARVAWNPVPGEPMKVAFYVPEYVDGAVGAEASAYDATGATIGRSSKQTGVVHPGETAQVVTLRLEKASAPTDGGAQSDGAVSPDAAALPDGAVSPDVTAGPDGAATVEAGPPDVATGLTWSPAENLENDSISRSFLAHVAIDGKGNALVAWSESTSVKIRRYDAVAKAWGDPKTVDTGGAINSVNVSMGANGHATLAWNYYPDSAKPLEAGPRVSHSKDGGLNWSPGKLLHNGLMYIAGVLAVSREGHARLVWEEKDQPADLNNLWSAHYNDTTGVWGDVAMVKLGTDRYDRFPKIAMNAQGGGLMVWVQPEGGFDSTYGAAFTLNQPPKAPQLLDNFTTNDTQDPAVAISSDGSKGLAMWVQRGSGPYDLYTAEFTADAGWKAPERFINAPDFVASPALTIDQTATVTAVWAQPIASGRVNLVAARRPAGQAWGALTALETANNAGGYIDETPVPVAGLDSVGNVHVAWARKLNPDRMDVAFSIVTRRFSGGMWLPEQTLAMKGPLRASDPDLAVGEDGRAAIGFNYYHPNGSMDADAYNAIGILFK